MVDPVAMGGNMKIAIGSDGRTHFTDMLVEELQKRGHALILYGPLSESDPDVDWPLTSSKAAEAVAKGEADEGIVCCWTGTGASIAANKVPGIRAALCHDAETAAGARKWNDANVLALSLRTTSEAVLAEILDAWFGAAPSADADDRANVAHLDEI